jgi:hypothetical protein
MLERKVGDVVRTAGEGRRRGRGAPAAEGDRRAPATGATAPAALAKEFARNDDPVIRQRVALYNSLNRINEMNQQRTRADAAAGRSPGPASSIGKLARSIRTRLNRDLGPEILGAHGMLAREDAPHGGAVTQSTLQAPSSSIAGGTDEIQHDIVGERALGLPKEPSVDRNIPFRQVRTNAVTRRPG